MNKFINNTRKFLVFRKKYKLAIVVVGFFATGTFSSWAKFFAALYKEAQVDINVAWKDLWQNILLIGLIDIVFVGMVVFYGKRIFHRMTGDKFKV